MKIDHNDFLKKQAVWVGKILGHEAMIVESPLMKKNEEINKILGRDMSKDVGYNGYVRFKKRPTIERGMDGILEYVPVWGGITYVDEDKKGIVYGFDTGHIEQENLPIRDKEWIKNQIKIMIKGIKRAKEVEKKYLVSSSNKERIKYIEYVFGKDKPITEMGFGAQIKILGGEL